MDPYPSSAVQQNRRPLSEGGWRGRCQVGGGRNCGSGLHAAQGDAAELSRPPARQRVVHPMPAICPCCGGDKWSKIGEDVTETCWLPLPRHGRVCRSPRASFGWRNGSPARRTWRRFSAPRYWPSFLDGARPTRSGRHIRIRVALGQHVDDPNALGHWAGRAAAPARYRGDRRRQADEWLHRRELPWRTYVRRAVALPSLDYCR
jgi:hypothetical protein